MEHREAHAALTRRTLFGRSAAAAATVTIIPRRVLGGADTARA